ncbi:hypothetical protein PTKIN_Ptkin17bG0069300 [Pterospermum kingtungense]
MSMLEIWDMEEELGNDRRAEDDFVDHDYEMEEDAELDADFKVNINFGVDRNIPVESARADYDNGTGFLGVSTPHSSAGVGGPRVDDDEDESKYGCSDELDSVHGSDIDNGRFNLKNVNDPSWQIKNYVGEHRCLLVMKNSNMPSKWMATHYLQKYVKDLDYSLTSLQQDVMKDFVIKVSLTKCCRARALALDIIYGTHNE